MQNTAYKIMPLQDWDQFQKSGWHKGTVDDVRDGFIHLSTLAQLAETLSKHYAAVEGLMLLEIDLHHIPKTELQWEEARGGTLFPHIYGDIPISAVRFAENLQLDRSGVHILPPELKNA